MIPAGIDYFAVQEDKVFIVTSSGGIHIKRMNTDPVFAADLGLPSVKFVRSVSIGASGRLFIGTDDGAYMLDDQKAGERSVPVKLAGGYSEAVLESSSGLIWVGNERGLFQYDGTHWTRWTTTEGAPFKW